NAELVRTIARREGAQVAELIQVCSALPRFDSGLLEAVLGETDTGAGHIAALREHTFVEPVQDPRGGFFRLHEFIRAELDNRFRRDAPEPWRECHRRAAEHIESWLSEYDEGESGEATYGAWYRYERPEWQAGIRDLLYHEARVAGRGGDQQSRLRFA